jgi:hypothetical protein
VRRDKTTGMLLGMKESYKKGEQRIHPGLESCGAHREVLVEA